MDEHGWHEFDVERDLYVRQVTPAGEPDRYEVRTGTDGPVTALSYAEFQELCGPGPNPKGL